MHYAKFLRRKEMLFFCSEEDRLVGGYSINIVATKLHRYAARGRQLLLKGYERNLQMKLFSTSMIWPLSVMGCQQEVGGDIDKRVGGGFG